MFRSWSAYALNLDALETSTIKNIYCTSAEAKRIIPLLLLHLHLRLRLRLRLHRHQKQHHLE